MIFEAEEVALKNLEGPQPSLQFRKEASLPKYRAT